MLIFNIFCLIVDTFEFMSGDPDGNIAFSVPFHYASTVQNAIAAGDFSFENRSRRLAQEISLLTNSLPLSFSSSVFVRCDESRLDLMKVSKSKEAQEMHSMKLRRGIFRRKSLNNGKIFHRDNL